LLFLCLVIFLFQVPRTTVTYTLSLHDALPISADLQVHRGDALFVDGDAAEGADGLGQIAVLDRRKGYADELAARLGNVNARGTVDRKSTRLNSSHVKISYAVFCLKKKKNKQYH